MPVEGRPAPTHQAGGFSCRPALGPFLLRDRQLTRYNRRIHQGGRPNLVPLALAATMPAFTRSVISPRS